MRMHITVDDELIRELDRRVGARRRSSFVAHLIRRALQDEARWDAVEKSVGTLEERGHEWDKDPAAWVRAGRRSDPRADR